MDLSAAAAAAACKGRRAVPRVRGEPEAAIQARHWEEEVVVVIRLVAGREPIPRVLAEEAPLPKAAAVAAVAMEEVRDKHSARGRMAETAALAVAAEVAVRVALEATAGWVAEVAVVPMLHREHQEEQEAIWRAVVEAPGPSLAERAASAAAEVAAVRTPDRPVAPADLAAAVARAAARAVRAALSVELAARRVAAVAARSVARSSYAAAAP
jgi:hypothetical protein